MRIGLREAFVTSAGVAAVASLLSGNELRIEGPYVGPTILLWLLLLWLVAGDDRGLAASLRLAIYVAPVVLLLLGLRLKFDSDACLDVGDGDGGPSDCERDLHQVEATADAVLTASAAAAVRSGRRTSGAGRLALVGSQSQRISEPPEDEPTRRDA